MAKLNYKNADGSFRTIEANTFGEWLAAMREIVLESKKTESSYEPIPAPKPIGIAKAVSGNYDQNLIDSYNGRFDAYIRYNKIEEAKALVLILFEKAFEAFNVKSSDKEIILMRDKAVALLEKANLWLYENNMVQDAYDLTGRAIELCRNKLKDYETTYIEALTKAMMQEGFLPQAMLDEYVKAKTGGVEAPKPKQPEKKPAQPINIERARKDFQKAVQDIIAIEEQIEKGSSTRALEQKLAEAQSLYSSATSRIKKHEQQSKRQTIPQEEVVTEEAPTKLYEQAYRELAKILYVDYGTVGNSLDDERQQENIYDLNILKEKWLASALEHLMSKDVFPKLRATADVILTSKHRQVDPIERLMAPLCTEATRYYDPLLGAEDVSALSLPADSYGLTKNYRSIGATDCPSSILLRVTHRNSGLGIGFNIDSQRTTQKAVSAALTDYKKVKIAKEPLGKEDAKRFEVVLAGAAFDIDRMLRVYRQVTGSCILSDEEFHAKLSTLKDDTRSLFLAARALHNALIVCAEQDYTISHTLLGEPDLPKSYVLFKGAAGTTLKRAVPGYSCPLSRITANEPNRRGPRARIDIWNYLAKFIYNDESTRSAAMPQLLINENASSDFSPVIITRWASLQARLMTFNYTTTQHLDETGLPFADAGRSALCADLLRKIQSQCKSDIKLPRDFYARVTANDELQSKLIVSLNRCHIPLVHSIEGTHVGFDELAFQMFSTPASQVPGVGTFLLHNGLVTTDLSTYAKTEQKLLLQMQRAFTAEGRTQTLSSAAAATPSTSVTFVGQALRHEDQPAKPAESAGIFSGALQETQRRSAVLESIQDALAERSRAIKNAKG